MNIPVVLAQVEREARALNKEKNRTIDFHIDKELYVFGVETNCALVKLGVQCGALHTCGGESVCTGDVNPMARNFLW